MPEMSIPGKGEGMGGSEDKRWRIRANSQRHESFLLIPKTANV
jgi:hypothetical protein